MTTTNPPEGDNGGSFSLAFTGEGVAQEFHRFPRLPCELRLMVWKEHFVSLGRLVPYDRGTKRVLPVKHMITPAINQESDAVFKSHYTIRLIVKRNHYPLMKPFKAFLSTERGLESFEGLLCSVDADEFESRAYFRWAWDKHWLFGHHGSYAPYKVNNQQKHINRGAVYLSMDSDTFLLGPNFQEFESSWSWRPQCSVTLLNPQTSALMPRMIKHTLDVYTYTPTQCSTSFGYRGTRYPIHRTYSNVQSYKHLCIKASRLQEMTSNLEDTNSGHDALEGEIRSSGLDIYERDEEDKMYLKISVEDSDSDSDSDEVEDEDDDNDDSEDDEEDEHEHEHEDEDNKNNTDDNEDDNEGNSFTN
ncbi:hypothetical protein SCUP515_01688 [Seiridium cupressi]